MKFACACLGLLTVLCLQSTAMCGIVYNLRFDQTSVTLSPGATSTFNILFEESVNDGSAHRLDLIGGTNGLIDGSFEVLVTGTGLTTATGGTGNAGFDNQDPIVPGNTTTFTQSIALNNPVFGTDATGGTYRIQLGTITVTAGNAGDANTLTLAGHPVNLLTIDDGFGGLAFTIDNALINFGSVNVNVTAVPEPATGFLGMLTISGIGWWRKKRAVKSA